MNLLQKIECYLEESGMSSSRFGRIAVSDPRLVTDLRNGRCLRPRTEKRILDLLTTMNAKVSADSPASHVQN